MKKQPRDSRFLTHIPEPRWQQVASIIFVVVIALIWLSFWLWPLLKLE